MEIRNVVTNPGIRHHNADSLLIRARQGGAEYNPFNFSKDQKNATPLYVAISAWLWPDYSALDPWQIMES
ncbi:MAG: hypothetical protein VX047_06925, partial [Pseudomonadota bacterium]|nr:hypothetical protein [Pseudomonadota bacterium]